MNNTKNITSEQHKYKLMWKSAVRAPSLRVLPWHLPYNWGKSTEKPRKVTYIGIMIVSIQDISGSFSTLEKWEAPSGQKILLMTDRRKILPIFTRLEQLFLIGCIFPPRRHDTNVRLYYATSPVAAKMYASNRYRVACCPRKTVRTTDNGDQQKKRKKFIWMIENSTLFLCLFKKYFV